MWRTHITKVYREFPVNFSRFGVFVRQELLSTMPSSIHDKQFSIILQIPRMLCAAVLLLDTSTARFCRYNCTNFKKSHLPGRLLSRMEKCAKLTSNLHQHYQDLWALNYHLSALHNLSNHISSDSYILNRFIQCFHILSNITYVTNYLHVCWAVYRYRGKLMLVHLRFNTKTYWL